MYFNFDYFFEVLYSIACVFLCGCLLFCLISGIIISCRENKLSKKVGNVTKTPIVPNWMEELLKKSYHTGTQPFIGFLCRTSSEKSTPNGHTKKIGEILKQRFGIKEDDKKHFAIPDSAFLVSVPMKNFKRGKDHTDFEPMSGKMPESYLTYQMFGDDSIQVITYHENDTSYIAGYCIYIKERNPFHVYNREVLETCHSAVKYPDPKGTVFLMNDEPFLCSWNLDKVAKSFKMYHCRRQNKPLMIGIESGEVKHFEWLEDFKMYQITECETCKVANYREELPPAYSFD